MNNKFRYAIVHIIHNGKWKEIGGKQTKKTGPMLAFHIKQKLINKGVAFDSVCVRIGNNKYFHSKTKEASKNQTQMPHFEKLIPISL